MKGVVVKFDTESGFGFIRTKGRRDDVFVHMKSVQGHTLLSVGQNVTFDIYPTPKGDHAVNVLPGNAQKSPSSIFFIAAAVITLLTMLGVVFGAGFTWLWAYLLAINIGTFALYAYDKSVAGGMRLRVPEVVLHVLALLGGTPAAFIGQQALRHKTIKGSFQAWFIGIVVLQVGAYIAYVMLVG